MKVNVINTAITEEKTIILYCTGRYPKKTKPLKDITLITRIWPNSKIIIYGNFLGLYKNNTSYFQNAFTGRNIQFVEKTIQTDINSIDADILWIHHENFNLFGGIVSDSLINIDNATKQWKKELYIFFNDELFAPYDDFKNLIDNRAKNPTFLTKNDGINDKITYKDNWENVNLLLNENKISNWGEKYISENLINKINQCYLSDIILYDLSKTKPLSKQKYDKKGCYVPLFTEGRLKVCNKIFNNLVDITFAGSRSNDLKDSIKGNGEYIKNEELSTFLKQYDWTIYIGKGRESKYLGATFYEPLLNGLPILIWTGTDPDKKIFENIDCYFSDENDIKRIINNTDLSELFNKQINHIWK